MQHEAQQARGNLEADREARVREACREGRGRDEGRGRGGRAAAGVVDGPLSSGLLTPSLMSMSPQLVRMFATYMEASANL